MKTILASEKSEYLHCLMNVINYNLTEEERKTNYNRMQELEKVVKDMGDELTIIVTSKNTNLIQSAPPMTMSKIRNPIEDS